MTQVLIVEDERPIARLIEMSLSRSGYACTVADDGLKAADLLGVLPEDCVVIEDSAVGVAAGVAAGMKVIALDRGQTVPQHFEGETWRVKDLSEIDVEKEFGA